MLGDVIVDIDGVVADCTQRLHHIKKESPDWPAFFEACDQDEPITPMIDFVRALQWDFRIFYLTGRPESIRAKTMDWLVKHKLPWSSHNSVVLMRANGDHRPDHEVKRELFDRSGIKHKDVAAVFEDRDRVVEMWRDLGLLCLQPKKGDY